MEPIVFFILIVIFFIMIYFIFVKQTLPLLPSKTQNQKELQNKIISHYKSLQASLSRKENDKTANKN